MARMRGLWTHLERLGAGRGVGGIGTRGPGESQIETDRRLARDRITALRRRLDHVRSTRAGAARRARARAPAERRARRLHERRQVDAAQRAHRRRGRRPRPALPHAGPDDPHAAAPGPHVPDDRHRRLHPQAAAPARRRVRARRSRRRAAPTSCCTWSTRASPRRTLVEMTRAVEDVLEEIHAGDSPRVLVLNKADALDDERRAELALPPPRRRARRARSPARGSRSCASASPPSSSARCADVDAARALLRGRHALRPARRRRRPLAHRHRRGRARHRAPARRRSPSATTATRSTARRRSRPSGRRSRTRPRRGRRRSGGSSPTARTSRRRARRRAARCGDPVARPRPRRARAAEVHEHDLDLAAVGRVDQARAPLTTEHPVPRRQPERGTTSSRRALRHRDRHAGRHDRPLARGQRERLHAAQVVARIAGARARGRPGRRYGGDAPRCGRRR